MDWTTFLFFLAIVVVVIICVYFFEQRCPKCSKRGTLCKTGAERDAAFLSINQFLGDKELECDYCGYRFWQKQKQKQQRGGGAGGAGM